MVKKKWVGGDLMKEDFCSFPENGEKKRKNKLEKLRRHKRNLK
jgi:hypothetical protein